MTGVLALLDDYHVQAIDLPEDPIQWHSHHHFFGIVESHDVRDRFNGEPLDLPLTFWVLRNVREALQSLTMRFNA
jgi:hypothetical protein